MHTLVGWTGEAAVCFLWVGGDDGGRQAVPLVLYVSSRLTGPSSREEPYGQKALKPLGELSS